jgi:hypothetical protein
MSHHAESRGHVATMLGLQDTRLEERYRLIMIVSGGEKENRRYSNRDVRKGSSLSLIAPLSTGFPEKLHSLRPGA